MTPPDQPALSADDSDVLAAAAEAAASTPQPSGTSKRAARPSRPDRPRPRRRPHAPRPAHDEQTGRPRAADRDRAKSMPAPVHLTASPRPRRSSRDDSPADPGLVTKLRLAGAQIYQGALPPERHRRLHLGALHATSDGLVEIAAGRRPPGGKLRILTRKDPGHYLPGGHGERQGEGQQWLDALLELAAAHTRDGHEVCVAPAVRADPAATKANVTHTNWLWIDVDGTEHLPAVKDLLRRKPAHLVIESAGSGGVHCYWRLRTPLRARTEKTRPEEAVDWPGWLTGGATNDTIERAHERLIYALGWQWHDGKPVPTVADAACRDRSRVMRLAGTINGKSGRHARIVWADFALAAWPLRDLIGDLPTPPKPKTTRRRPGTTVTHDDPYKRIAPVEYFHALARIDVPAHGLVSCPSPNHTDSTPSCHVGKTADEGWCCHGCDAGGAIYDLASVLEGGPTGQWLRGEQFRRAHARVRAAFNDR